MLEGEKKDWEKILTRLEKLQEYGDETTAWYYLLVPVVSRFVRAFDSMILTPRRTLGFGREWLTMKRAGVARLGSQAG